MIRKLKNHDVKNGILISLSSPSSQSEYPRQHHFDDLAERINMLKSGHEGVHWWQFFETAKIRRNPTSARSSKDGWTVALSCGDDDSCEADVRVVKLIARCNSSGEKLRYRGSSCCSEGGSELCVGGVWSCDDVDPSVVNFVARFVQLNPHMPFNKESN